MGLDLAQQVVVQRHRLFWLKRVDRFAEAMIGVALFEAVVHPSDAEAIFDCRIVGMCVEGIIVIGKRFSPAPLDSSVRPWSSRLLIAAGCDSGAIFTCSTAAAAGWPNVWAWRLEAAAARVARMTAQRPYRTRGKTRFSIRLVPIYQKEGPAAGSGMHGEGQQDFPDPGVTTRFWSGCHRKPASAEWV